MSGALDRVVVRSFEVAVRTLWGFTPRVMEFVVADLGPGPAVAWMASHMPRYQRTLQVLGPVRTHLACLAVSLVNGCRYCSYGQAYALELLHLRERGTLFPVDAGTVAGWAGAPVDELRARLRAALEQAGLHAEVVWTDGAFDLAVGAHPPMGADEERVAHLVTMIGQLNRVGTAHGLEPDEAHDPVNKDAALRARNAALRAA